MIYVYVLLLSTIFNIGIIEAMADFPKKYKWPKFGTPLVSDEKVNIGDYNKGRRLKMDYTIYNTYIEPGLRDCLFTQDTENRNPTETFIKSLDLLIEKKQRSSISRPSETRQPLGIQTQHQKRMGVVQYPGTNIKAVQKETDEIEKSTESYKILVSLLDKALNEINEIDKEKETDGTR